ncbi:TOBE domain-containing protein [Pseudomonas entomophila]|jgi:molybdate transport system regulatory protein|uniref:TOBE domain-containing protein n=1 Tax=Pseudomonas entomophila TaxID=312306 RepID=UPI0015E49681|nr:TOBE domain-containing protein [Pseudomonas entomophila]MBA1192382.1 TOBE domain-containing protein [Pseudomonas entomophila]
MSLPALLTQHIARRPHRVALLQHIAEQGSITQAAKAAGMSYKAAWDAIDELNNLAMQPLVERSTGGRGGGGARLSGEGERVLRLYLRLQALQAQVLEAAEHLDDLALLGRLTLHTSARNQWQGQVSAITPAGRHDLLSLTLADGLVIVASITRGSTQRLALEAGATVIALLKAGAVTLSHAPGEIDAACNRLRARVESVEPDPDGPSELSLQLDNGQTLCAFAEAAWLEAHAVQRGDVLWARFEASQVLLGVPA